MAHVKIEIVNEYGFKLSFDGGNDNADMLKDSVTNFLNASLNSVPAPTQYYKLKLSNLNVYDDQKIGFKIRAIKVLREVTGCTLKDGKDFVELFQENPSHTAVIEPIFNREQAVTSANILRESWTVDLVNV